MEIKTAKTERQEADEALAEAKAMRATEKAKFLKTSEEQRATIVWALAESFASLRGLIEKIKKTKEKVPHVHFFLLTTSALSSLAVEMTLNLFFAPWQRGINRTSCEGTQPRNGVDAQREFSPPISVVDVFGMPVFLFDLFFEKLTG